MRLYLFILLVILTSCSNEPTIGTYKAFWYETYHELKLKKSHFNYIVEGHMGNFNIDGTYKTQEDTIFLATEKLPNKFLIYNNTCLIELESGYEFCKRNQDEWLTKQHVLNSNRLENYNPNQLSKFPEIELNEIFEFYETSGLVEKSPSKKYFNPDNDGIFVFYSLFNRSENQIAEIGSLITHTYYKDDYGWATEDKDQTFIELNIISDKVTIGQSIQVGREIGDFIQELGLPILKNDSIAIFAGSGNRICLATLEKDRVNRIKFGRYSFDKRINEELISGIK